MAPIYLGEFEYAVLLAILHLDEDAYAVPIRELIEQRTDPAGRQRARSIPGSIASRRRAASSRAWATPPRSAAARRAATTR